MAEYPVILTTYLLRSDIGPAREATDVSDERHAVPVKKKKDDDDEVVLLLLLLFLINSKDFN